MGEQELHNLMDGVERFGESSQWQNYLQVQSRFREYSATNALRIALQCPQASRVGGYQTWKKTGRYVRRGEVGIRIVAPIFDKETGQVVRYRAVTVFDVSQTEGDPLPEVCELLVQRALPETFEALRQVARELGFTVSQRQLPEGVNGYCSCRTREISLDERLPLAHRIKTLVHELAHGLLHSTEKERARAELEAESVAYIVCHRVGLESGDYSFGYLTAWAGDPQAARTAIIQSARRIRETADRIASSVESCYGAPLTKLKEAQQVLSRPWGLPEGDDCDGAHDEEGPAHCVQERFDGNA